MEESIYNVIKRYDRIAIFSGAGVSSDSNLITFRGNKGIYGNNDEIHPMFIRRSFNHGSHIDSFIDMFNTDNKEPNKAHYFAKLLDDSNRLEGVITQNIDDLYEKTGLNKDKIVHIHGEYNKLKCKKCGRLLEMTDMYKSKKGKYHSNCCNFLVDTEVVLYGDNFNRSNYKRYLEILDKSDALFVMGTGLDIITHRDIISSYNKDKILVNKEDVTLGKTKSSWGYYNNNYFNDWTFKFLGEFKDIL